MALPAGPGADASETVVFSSPLAADWTTRRWGYSSTGSAVSIFAAVARQRCPHAMTSTAVKAAGRRTQRSPSRAVRPVAAISAQNRLIDRHGLVADRRPGEAFGHAPASGLAEAGSALRVAEGLAQRPGPARLVPPPPR